MPQINLNTLLELVGELDDSADPKSASGRFRQYVESNIIHASDLRAYVVDALANSGAQYNRALQDLINRVGELLGFDVQYGRYRGVKGQIGFDGLWRSASGKTLVVESKTTDVYAVRTATLLGYINDLVSSGELLDPGNALGLYVYGRFDAQANQLENAIIAEGRRERLRIISVQALLDLLELKQDYNLGHETVLSLLLPTPVSVDPLVNLISNIVSQERGEQAEAAIESPEIESEISGPQIRPAEARERRGIPQKKQAKSSDPVKLAPLKENYTGRKPVAVVFQGKRYEVATWQDALFIFLKCLHKEKRAKFESVALEVRGRKRPYFTKTPEELRAARLIDGSSIYAETNISANYIVKICFTLLDLLGYPTEILRFEVES